MSDDDWDREDFEPPPVTKVVAVAATKIQDEEEEEGPAQQETVESLRAQLERVTREFESYRKGVEAAKERKNAKKREEEELQGLLMSEADRKAKEKMLLEQEQLAQAQDLFGSSGADTAAKAATAAAKAPQKDELTRLVELVTARIESHSKAASFSANIDRLVTSVTKPLAHERMKELGDKLCATAREKAKETREKKKGAAQAQAKKPLQGGGVKANSKRFAELDDYYDGADEDFDEDDFE